jgi:SHS2 domain-containing protein
MEPKFEFLEHVADAYVAAYGLSLSEAFQNAAFAMFELMTDTRKIEHRAKDEVTVEGFDEKALLYNWLEQLLLKFEIEGNVYSQFEISELVHNDKGWRLTAVVFGEAFDPAKHESRVEIKAVTYHQMEIDQKGDVYCLKFLLDL